MQIYGKMSTNLTCDVTKPCVYIQKRAQKRKNAQSCLVQPLPLLCFQNQTPTINIRSCGLSCACMSPCFHHCKLHCGFEINLEQAKNILDTGCTEVNNGN